VDLGPITAQSQEVWQSLIAANRLVHWRFNHFRRGGANQPPGLTEAERQQLVPLREQELRVIDRMLEARRKHLYELARPKSHRFELAPVK
jgi:hypothetical protein